MHKFKCLNKQQQPYIYLPFIDYPLLIFFFFQDLPIFMLIMHGETQVARMNCGHQNFIFMLMQSEPHDSNVILRTVIGFEHSSTSWEKVKCLTTAQGYECVDIG